ncbi:A/G-specific adenine glycosylase [Halarchaeum acidiphilum MH1-52-1]|uniref:A/G-specific adenine glycosylase n=1 Tax=Halarchaeum acidiphilum MH1-52-1 TaxID=1261545 RepID=U2YXB4_9EURY|nr:A/G-specific adenine glycosylase [Halarchaeum acidiphilum]GAD53690.1 A/G-specific adenine glycosylase [Halarchaeum acidiphilum MH1-52-1]
MTSTRRVFVERLLDWYHENGRHALPWREDSRTAFEILVAEVLLQRTTASAVEGAYVSFVARYPTPACLVAAPSDRLVDAIEPLGLTKRAGHLERCSAQLWERYAGRVPAERTALLSLHGVGEYTARSVLIHAFGEHTVAVDTNVRRLVSRFFGIDPHSDALGETADALAPEGRSGDFLHAMLDFAASVCRAREPRCDSCPLRTRCRRFESGRASRIERSQ